MTRHCHLFYSFSGPDVSQRIILWMNEFRHMMIKCGCYNISGTLFVGGSLVIAGTSEYVTVFHLVILYVYGFAGICPFPFFYCVIHLIDAFWGDLDVVLHSGYKLQTNTKDLPSQIGPINSSKFQRYFLAFGCRNGCRES